MLFPRSKDTVLIDFKQSQDRSNNTMRLPKPVRDNLSFLLAETTAQARNLQVLLETSSKSAAQRIIDRRGYAYNLKMRIHDGCMTAARRARRNGALDVLSLRAAEVIATELEDITELGQDCVRQLSGQKRKAILESLTATKFIDNLIAGVLLIRKSLEEDDTQTALKIGNIARKVNKKHTVFFDKQSRGLKKQKYPADTIVTLLVARNLNEMGAALLGISEAIISAKLGHTMHTERFRSLETAFVDLGLNEGLVESIAETKSGSAISGISEGDQDGYVAIFKDGQKEKLKEERESVKSWHEIFPGLAPRILSYRKRGANASLLIEHLPGFTFEQVLLNESDALLASTIKHLGKTVQDVWNETKRSRKVPAKHMSQLRKRLDSVRGVHQNFSLGGEKICSASTRSLDQLINKVEALENKIHAPFSVYIHGDFNLDNIIFDPDNRRINFIDLHRSCYSDYIQDVSVLMVSSYRLQVLDTRTRKRIRLVATRFYEIVAEYAHKNDDKTFELRLAFGLGRSFITSTRFILDKSLAKAMYLRGCYILERASEQTVKTAPQFKLPIKELF